MLATVCLLLLVSSAAVLGSAALVGLNAPAWATAMSIAPPSPWLPSVAGAAPALGSSVPRRSPSRNTTEVTRARDERPAASSRGLLHRVFPSMAGAQRRLARALSERTRALDEHPSPSALALAWALGLASGALAAAGPGHGKIVIAAFFAVREARAAMVIGIAALIAAMQAATGAAVVWLLAVVLGRERAGVLAGADRVELAAYALVTLIGLAMVVVSAVSGRARPRGGAGESHRVHVVPREHATSPGDAASVAGSAGSRASRPHREVADSARFRCGDWSLALATGLIPSAGTIAFLYSAVASGVAGAGVAVALAMAGGIAVTLSVVALLGHVGRAVVLRVAGRGRHGERWAERGLAVGGWALIAVAGVLFSWTAWENLG